MQLKTKSSLHPEDPSTKVEYKEDSFITEYTGNVMCITGIHWDYAKTHKNLNLL